MEINNEDFFSIWYLSVQIKAHKENLRTKHEILKDADREKVSSNKIPALKKCMYMDIWVVITSNQLLIRDS